MRISNILLAIMAMAACAIPQQGRAQDAISPGAAVDFRWNADIPISVSTAQRDSANRSTLCYRIEVPGYRLQVSTKLVTHGYNRPPPMEFRLYPGPDCAENRTYFTSKRQPQQGDYLNIYTLMPIGSGKYVQMTGFRSYVEAPGTYSVQIGWSNAPRPSSQYARSISMPIFSMYIGDFGTALNSSFTNGTKYWPVPSLKTLNFLANQSATSASLAFRDEARHAPGTSFSDCAEICPEMVAIPAGSFMMGSPSSEAGRAANEGPIHQVTISKPFAMGKYEVTNAEWSACVADGACANVGPQSKEARAPVGNVSWGNVQAYIAWLSKKTGQPYFLPSESEWEYAARAGTSTPWNTGEAIIADDANILKVFNRAVPVGSFPPNAFGLYDIYGNVAEMTADCVSDGYFGRDGTAKPYISKPCSGFVYRGGNFASTPDQARSARRIQFVRFTQFDPSLGFRVARAL